MRWNYRNNDSKKKGLGAIWQQGIVEFTGSTVGENSHNGKSMTLFFGKKEKTGR